MEILLKQKNSIQHLIFEINVKDKINNNLKIHQHGKILQVVRKELMILMVIYMKDKRKFVILVHNLRNNLKE